MRDVTQMENRDITIPEGIELLQDGPEKAQTIYLYLPQLLIFPQSPCFFHNSVSPKRVCVLPQFSVAMMECWGMSIDNSCVVPAEEMWVGKRGGHQGAKGGDLG